MNEILRNTIYDCSFQVVMSLPIPCQYHANPRENGDFPKLGLLALGA